ncbi:hypothetical protein BWI17_21420 [Betaproteobacteria bacterium GR16-43]|nr:hypothetical protein BWI17_21420 [Betaproteobacteria bacterium GR16-43]
MNLRPLAWSVGATLLALLMVVATALGGSFLLELFVPIDAKGNPVDPVGLVAYTVVPFGLLLIVLVAWVRFVEKRGLEALGLATTNRIPKYLRGYAIGVASMVAIVGVTWAVGGYSATGPGTAWASPREFLVIAMLMLGLALQSSVEELLFRGWLLGTLSRKANVPVAVLLSSALFALLHFSRGHLWLDWLALFLFAFFCCAWRLRTGNTLGAMGWHSGWNWILGVGFGLPLSGIDVGLPSLVVNLVPQGARWLNGGPQGPESSVACVVYFIAGSLLLMRKQGPS